MKKIAVFAICLCFLSTPLLFAKDDPPESEDQAQDTEDEATPEKDSPVKGMAKGVKQVAYDGPKEFAKETVEEAPKKPPIVGVVEGVNKGTQKLLDHTVKGAYKVATLGTSELESYKVEEPEKGSDETTKIRISLPGT